MTKYLFLFINECIYFLKNGWEPQKKRHFVIFCHFVICHIQNKRREEAPDDEGEGGAVTFGDAVTFGNVELPSKNVTIVVTHKIQDPKLFMLYSKCRKYFLPKQIPC